jgi:large subunit ribosomal protein L34
MTTHYEKRRSHRKRSRKFGFLARMKSTTGRKMLNRKRRLGRAINVKPL